MPAILPLPASIITAERPIKEPPISALKGVKFSIIYPRLISIKVKLVFGAMMMN
jgi:hypothetical protein